MFNFSKFYYIKNYKFLVYLILVLVLFLTISILYFVYHKKIDVKKIQHIQDSKVLPFVSVSEKDSKLTFIEKILYDIIQSCYIIQVKEFLTYLLNEYIIFLLLGSGTFIFWYLLKNSMLYNLKLIFLKLLKNILYNSLTLFLIIFSMIPDYINIPAINLIKKEITDIIKIGIYKLELLTLIPKIQLAVTESFYTINITSIVIIGSIIIILFIIMVTIISIIYYHILNRTLSCIFSSSNTPNAEEYTDEESTEYVPSSNLSDNDVLKPVIMTPRINLHSDMEHSFGVEDPNNISSNLQHSIFNEGKNLFPDSSDTDQDSVNSHSSTDSTKRSHIRIPVFKSRTLYRPKENSNNFEKESSIVNNSTSVIPTISYTPDIVSQGLPKSKDVIKPLEELDPLFIPQVLDSVDVSTMLKPVECTDSQDLECKSL